MKPLDLTGYTPKKRKIIREEGFFCVYAMGRGEGHPVKIGYASDIVERQKNLQGSQPEQVHVWHLMWFPGKPVVKRIEMRCHELLKLAGKHRSGEWFDLPLVWAQRTIDNVARNLYPQSSIKTHENMVRALQLVHLEKSDVEGVDAFPKINDIHEIQIQSRIMSPAAITAGCAPLGGLSHAERRTGWKWRFNCEDLRIKAERTKRREARRKRA